MQYKNLHDLVMHSSSSRKFLLSLPVKKQLKLHNEFDGIIHNAQDLHSAAESIEKYEKQIEISNSLDNLFKKPK